MYMYTVILMCEIYNYYIYTVYSVHCVYTYTYSVKLSKNHNFLNTNVAYMLLYESPGAQCAHIQSPVPFPPQRTQPEAVTYLADRKDKSLYSVPGTHCVYMYSIPPLGIGQSQCCRTAAL